VLLEGFLEPRLVHGKTVLRSKLLGQFNRIPIGIVQLEGGTAADLPAGSLEQVGKHFLKFALALCQGLGELGLFQRQFLEYELAVLYQLRIRLAIQGKYDQCELPEESPFDSQLIAVANRPPDQTP